MDKGQKAVENYQCTGCLKGSSTKDGCYKKSGDSSCLSHIPGTMILGLGKILLGYPKGFNRMGPVEKMNTQIFQDEKEFSNTWGEYDKFNVPVWKYKSEEGHVIVRGLSPRTNSPFIHIFLYDRMDKINCLEITKQDLEGMD